MNTQSKGYRTGEEIYDNISCDGFFNMNAMRIQTTFPPIGTFTLDSTLGPPPAQSQNQPPISQHQTPIGIFDANDVPEVIQNPATIGVFQSNSVLSNGGSGGGGGNNSSIFSSQSSSSSAANDPSQATRETGIIEKLLHSYGFIQCCERQARLFFHFSQFSGNIDHLKIGDPVEFEMTYDRRTGKPIASQVSKIAPEVVLSEERVTGTVTTELRTDCANNLLSSSETTGRISYENRGECFFLPYTKDDVEGNVNLRAGDKVSFQIATNQRGNLGACHIRLENPAQPVKYRGVVCSMKESFGFIERADVVKEIFFHFSEAEGNVELRPGDDVEFTIQTRNGREFACNITRLPPGSVIFEDVDTTIYKGQVLKPLDRNNPARQTNDPLPGRIRYRAPDYSEVEVPFGDKDQKGDFTLRHGDWVQFLLATDRRDQLQRATSISLLDETFKVSGEKREQGVVASLKDGFGFLRCVERNLRLFFHFTEVLDTSREIAVNDEVEFTVVQEPGVPYNTSRLHAIRIKHLPPNTVQFEMLMASNIEGSVTREAPKSPVKSQDRVEGGVITYDHGDVKKTIMYFLKDCEKPPRIGDRVRFDIYLVKRNKEFIAVNVQLIGQMQQLHQQQLQQQQQQQSQLMLTNTTNQLQQHQHMHNQNNEQMLMSNGVGVGLGVGVAVGVGVGVGVNTGGNSCGMLLPPQNGYLPLANSTQLLSTPKIEDFKLDNNNLTMNEHGQTYRGFIAVIKENFGFIETLSHDEEVFFHFSNYVGNPNWLELGQEVEYTLSPNGNTSASGNCLPAENVRTLPKGSIPQPAVLEGIHNGIVARPLRCINPDQQEYAGLIEVLDETKQSVLTQHEFGITSLVNKRDLLQKGDLVTFKIDEIGRAAEINAVRQKKRATVDSIKGQFGFLNYEIEDGKKLFFHMSEVQGNAVTLHPGDTVEFSVVTNQRNGKSSACNVLKINDRPDRLISRLKLNADDTVPRLIITRAPRGPQSKGFLPQARIARIPGIIIE
ncbi:cold shock domain-containing protein E1 isoform X1 [Anastrepha obliqua]|uniref:cold shock domain-containing protein E1 isoform X1 n=2 Tax=Anastrepha obliqua TaxID=95512 RepID=UPI0024092CC6|nr:cold shock domain-containing protein E1 isoform X1 [Anastrepha obliqua]XP_054735137.1 cold shock domain-containing protein E1 isoform X1 [Anastrepha obliqua]